MKIGKKSLEKGSAYFNYKHAHSILLLAICDANDKFIAVDIGAYGRRSDGGKRAFNSYNVDVLEPKKLQVDGNPLPYVLVGDEAFQLTDYLLRLYPGRGGLNMERTILNYRLGRARRTIENAFGILVSLWRLLKMPIESTVDNTMIMAQAVTCLHNWLRKRDEEYLPEDLGMATGNHSDDIEDVMNYKVVHSETSEFIIKTI